MSTSAHWDERYRSGNIPWDTGSPSRELLRVVNEDKIAPGRVIDLGCGTGANAVWLAQHGFDVTAVDLSPAAVARAAARAEEAGVSIRCLAADLLAPPELGGPFDFLFDRGCYHAVRRTNVAAYLRTLTHLTRPGTLGLFLTGNAREPHEPGPPVVTEQQIRDELGSLFTVIRLREFWFDQVEGELRHLAWSCLVRREA